MGEKSVLVDTLKDKGFVVTKPLQGAGSAAIFCVREAEAGPGSDLYVAKVVSLGGLDAKGRAAAMQEVSMLRGLAPHPNLISYRQSYLEDASRVLLIVMSFAEDGDLSRQVALHKAAERKIPEPLVNCWFRQSLSGVGHLHSQGVMHRDVKCSNIFLCENRRRIRIGDFGISRVLESTAFATSAVGTPAYMSPELMRNERYDYHVDMWALGCVCFELCTLTLPFLAKSLLDLVYAVTDADPDWSLLVGYSDDVQGAVARMLQKQPDSRPTADSLLAEPFFAEGGLGAAYPPDETWAQLA